MQILWARQNIVRISYLRWVILRCISCPGAPCSEGGWHSAFKSASAPPTSRPEEIPHETASAAGSRLGSTCRTRDQDDRRHLYSRQVQEKPVEGEIVAVGPGAPGTDGELLSIAVKDGDRVLFNKWSGTAIKVEGEDLLIMPQDEILGVFDHTIADVKAA